MFEVWMLSNSIRTYHIPSVCDLFRLMTLRTFSADSKFDKCFKCLVVECWFVEKSLFRNWFRTICTDSQRELANWRGQFFLKFNLSHKLQLLNVQRNFCSVMCYTVLIWTLILLTLGNNSETLLFNLPKPVYYFPTDKVNASIRICIRRMRILTSFVTSLNCKHMLLTVHILFAGFITSMLFIGQQMDWTAD